MHGNYDLGFGKPIYLREEETKIHIVGEETIKVEEQKL